VRNIAGGQQMQGGVDFRIQEGCEMEISWGDLKLFEE
jgi:hypothetical protein